MCELYNRLLSLCNKKGVSGAKMCRECGVSKSLMSDLKYGRRDTISSDTAVKIAEYFGITVEEVLKGIKKQPTPVFESELDAALIKMLTDLTPSEVLQVVAFAEGLKANREA